MTYSENYVVAFPGFHIIKFAILAFKILKRNSVIQFYAHVILTEFKIRI